MASAVKAIDFAEIVKKPDEVDATFISPSFPADLFSLAATTQTYTHAPGLPSTFQQPGQGCVHAHAEPTREYGERSLHHAGRVCAQVSLVPARRQGNNPLATTKVCARSDS